MISNMMESFTEEFAVMQKTLVPDGEGGSRTTWTNGMTFKAAFAHDTTVQAQIAEGEKTASTYTLLIPAGMDLNYPDAIKRIIDSQTYQITSDSDDKRTPSTSMLNLKAVKAKKWSLP